MFFLLRVAFWIGVVLVILPTGKTQEASNAPQVGATEAVTAATGAMSDLSQFCSRQPATCEIGGQAATVIGHRVQAGARTVYEFISEKAEKNGKTEPKSDTAPDVKPDTRAEPKHEPRQDPRAEPKAAAKSEPKPEKKLAKPVKKNPDHTGSIADTGQADASGAPAFENSTAHMEHTPDWSISIVETVAVPVSR